MKRVKIVSIDDAVDSIGIGRFQHEILFSAGLCFMADAIEVTLLSFLSPVLKLEWGLSNGEAASIVSSVFAGAMLGTLILGPLGDVAGRRPMFFLAASLIAIFGFCTAFTYNFLSLLVTRAVVGFGVGGLTIPFDLLLEVLPTEERGKYLLWIEFYWSAGSVMVPLIAWLTLGNGLSWNVFVFVCAVPCLFSVLSGIFFVPESPRWLLEAGRIDEAAEVLRRGARKNGMNPVDLFPMDGSMRLVSHYDNSNDINNDNRGSTCTSSNGNSFDGDTSSTKQYFQDKVFGPAQLLSKTWRGLTLTIWLLWYGYSFAYYGTVQVITKVFEINDNGDDSDGDGAADFDYMAILVSALAEIIGLFVVLATIDRWGRIPTQMVFYALGGLSVFALCYVSSWFPSSRGGATVAALILTTLAFVARSCGMGAACVTWVSTSEMLPTELRSTGHSSANAVARLGSSMSPYVVQGGLSMTHVGWIFLAIHVVTVWATSRLPETKGKQLGDASAANHSTINTKNIDEAKDNAPVNTKNAYVLF